MDGIDEKDMKEFAELSTLNPFSADLSAVPSQWAIDATTKSKYDNRFAQLELSSDAKVFNHYSFHSYLPTIPPLISYHMISHYVH